MTPEILGNLLVQNFGDLVASAQIGTGQARAVLADGSFIDIWFNERVRYSYHWQQETGAIYRFNNAPHHPQVVTHPNHFHDGSQNNLKESPIRGVAEDDVEVVMEFIRSRMNKS